MPQNEAWTIGRLLKWTTDYLKQHGADSPRLDAEVLLAFARGCQRIELYTSFEVEADEQLRREFRELVKHRAAGTPVAYLVGHREFYSYDFAVSPDVLIPRPETEFVVIGLLDAVRAAGQVQADLRIADVGTGSGILAICAALQLPHARIWALDVSTAALDVARQNAKRHGVSERIEWVQSDLFAGLAETEPFDYIVSNPPYIAESERSQLPRDVVAFEPASALFAGPDGLDVLGPLIEQAPAWLVPGGWLFAEFSPPQRDELVQMVGNQSEWRTPRFLDDLDKQPRVLQVQRRSLTS